jgi:hypothetical protein
VKREKEVMAKLKSGKDNPWMINLISSFQDAEHLYLCMVRTTVPLDTWHVHTH